jgi:tRNA1(Val) A37 N6-methylase TrmN6
VLLRVESELPHLVRQVYSGKGTDLFAAQEQGQWQAAEARLRETLEAFAQAGQSSYQGRLFAQDALQGLRLIDMSRTVFDVVVMNPPFGALAAGTKDRLVKAYPRSKNDLLAIFVERGLELLRSGGRLGAITSRTCFFLSSFQRWREEVVLGVAQPEAMADLGHGVMDDAMVEAAAYALVKA